METRDDFSLSHNTYTDCIWKACAAENIHLISPVK